MDFDQAITGLPEDMRMAKPHGSPHSAWELLEHLRIAQWDMLEFSRNAKHVSPEWPKEYWPVSAVPADDAAWNHSVEAFHHDLAAMRKMVADPASDLFTPFKHGEGQTLLREVLQLADHNAYHIGELVSLRKVLGAWKSP